jgi:hypothetical protein
MSGVTLEDNGRAKRFFKATGFHLDGATRLHEASGLPLMSYLRPIPSEKGA